MKTSLPTVVIQSCSSCPNKEERNPSSSDGCDRMVDWFCKKNGQKIQAAVEWHEETKIPIPVWCPLKNT